MAAKDITALRPWYLSATMLRDYHYAVYNAAGDKVLVLVTRVGESSSFFVDMPIQYEHKVVYVNNINHTRISLGRYTRDCTDLINALSYYRYPPGQYGMSVCDATGKRLYTFEFTFTE